MQAAIGCAQIEKLDGFVKARRNNWQILYDGLKDLEKFSICLPEEEKKELENKQNAEMDAKAELENAQKKVAKSEAEKKELLIISKNKESNYNYYSGLITSFLKEDMWNKQNAFYRGCNDYELWLDAQTWGYLLLGSNYLSALNTAETSMKNSLVWYGKTVNGHQYNNYNKNSIWVEGTAQMALAYAIEGNTDKSQYYLNEINKVTQADGGVIYSFSNTVTTISWPDNLIYPSVAPTVWKYFARTKFNPFTS
jgi:hypothetical protein